MKKWEWMAMAGGLIAGLAAVRGVIVLAQWLDNQKEWKIRAGWRKPRQFNWVARTRVNPDSQKKWSAHYKDSFKTNRKKSYME